MGCNESKEEETTAASQPFLDGYQRDQFDQHHDSIDSPNRPIPLSPTMGQPSQLDQGIPLGGSSRLAQQHERLILELLPFKDANQFQE